MTRRTERLNSLLKEVLSKVIRSEVKHPDVTDMITVTKVDITRDLTQAKVHVSVIGEQAYQEKAVKALNVSAGFIAVTSSKMVVMRHFPELTFYLDREAEIQQRMHTLIQQVQEEREERKKNDGRGNSTH